MKRNTTIVLALVAILAGGCVPKKKLLNEQAINKSLQLANQGLKEDLEKIEDEKKKAEQEKKELQSTLEKITGEKNDCLTERDRLRKQLAELQGQYDNLMNQNKLLLASTSAERQKLSEELEKQRLALDEKQKLLNRQQSDMDALKKDLEEREKKVAELQSLIDAKDNALKTLKENIEKALLSFNPDELTVEMRDGKIYVTMTNQLLFKSGSAVVDKKGEDALLKISSVLAKQEDIDIQIEGHTDNDPIATSCVKDNWDLSVLRATAIVRILTEKGKVDVKKVVPSGRGEYLPVGDNKTDMGKAKNRRTEIILAPRLDKIFQLLEGE